MIKVTQADRIAAAKVDAWQKLCTDEEPLAPRILAGELDDTERVQIFARHRQLPADE